MQTPQPINTWRTKSAISSDAIDAMTEEHLSFDKHLINAVTNPCAFAAIHSIEGNATERFLPDEGHTRVVTETHATAK